MRIVFLGFLFTASAHYFHQSGLNNSEFEPRSKSITLKSYISVLTTALISGLDAKKKNPWKKTVGKPPVKTPTYLKIWSDLEKKTNWAINKIKKSASIETIIATQIFAAGKISNSDLRSAFGLKTGTVSLKMHLMKLKKVIISMFMAIFKRLFRKKPKVQTGIPREKFIQLINLGYDKFKSKEEIQEFVEEGKYLTDPHFRW